MEFLNFIELKVSGWMPNSLAISLVFKSRLPSLASISFNFSITSCICILNPLILISKNLNIKFQKARKRFYFKILSLSICNKKQLYS
uniref:Uncharacterized protein n=1 Tax=Campylobacter jejuni TaxID=197 RepID=E5F1W0_CAMJU|nr:hypothetical protein [Campylobacter jejuni]